MSKTGDSVTSLLPEGAVFIGGITVISYLDSDGDEAWAHVVSGISADTAISLLEKLKLAIALPQVAQLVYLDESDSEVDT